MRGGGGAGAGGGAVALLLLLCGAGGAHAQLAGGGGSTHVEGNPFTCPNGWELQGLHCYKFFNIKHSWEKAAELCRRYGSELAAVESYGENNASATLAAAALGSAAPAGAARYWLGLAAVDDLRTNTLESAAGALVSQYAGFWDLRQPDPRAGECVDAAVSPRGTQAWRLTACETLLPFMCRADACPAGTFHCSNGRCVNAAFKCDKQDDCGDGSDEMDCVVECHYYMASSGDVLESPAYPHKYPALADCKWTLEGPQGHNILLQFQDFDTEKSFDTVQVLVGGRTEDRSVSLATLSGKQDLAGRSFVSASNFMIVKFSSDASVERKGFRASWKTEPSACGGVLRATPQGQVLTSPGYPRTAPGGLECLYIIEAPPGRVVSLEVDELELGLDRDYILVKDGASPDGAVLARLTGPLAENRRVVVSTSSNIYLYFRTGLGGDDKSFKLRFVQGCRATLVTANGTLSSPAYGIAEYPGNLECLYRIKNPGGGPLSLKFDEFQIHPSDVVQVYEGAGTDGLRLHADGGFTSRPRITLTATGGEMLVRFVSDALHGGPGWRASFSADCPTLQTGEGALASSRDTAFGTEVSCSCPVGQEFATGKTRITTECRSGGTWSVSYIPSCQEVYCGPVPQIDNGFSIGSTNVTYRGVATYQCYAGFAFPTGAPLERIACLADGRWERTPACLASQCSPLPEVAHANVSVLNGGGRGYGTIVRYECEPGFVRAGRPVLLCMSDGSWSGEVPTCSRAACRTLPVVFNGYVVDRARTYLYGDEARIQCNRGYKLTGASVLRCGAGQQFDPAPTCEDINECVGSQCDAASTECRNTPGAFHCPCRTGFAPSLDCRPVGDLGLVGGAVPDSAIATSASERGYDGGMVRLNGGGWCGANIEAGANWVTVDLRAPTIVRGFRTTSVVRADGHVAFTSAIRIQYTNELSDVFKDYTNPDGTAVEFRILEPTLSVLNLPLAVEARYLRLRIQDYVGAPCLKLELMGCARLDCLDINECADNNGGCDHKCINTPGNFSCSCDVGYELYAANGTGGVSVARGETGERDGDTYRKGKSCVPLLCPALPAPENGLLLSAKERHRYGDVVTFQCNFGYVMSGAAALACTASGAWNGTAPDCQYARCVTLSDEASEGLAVARADPDSVLVPYRDNVTLSCRAPGRQLRNTLTAGFRQCVYDPKPGYPDYWLSGAQPACPRRDCGVPPPAPGAEYGHYVDTRFQSSFFFGCQNTFKLAGQTSKHDNVVRCQANGVWDFGDLRCEGPVCEDPGRPADGFQVSRSFEQGSEVVFGCSRPGYILINPRPITCVREPECKVIRPLGLASGRIPDAAINATSERPNYEAKHIRLNSVTGWCGKQEAFTYVSVDLGRVNRVKAILVKGVVTADIVGRPTEIRFFYKQTESENYVVYFPNFNLTMRDPGNYGELAMITLPKYVAARYVILGIISFMDNACLKFELMGCEEPTAAAAQPLLGYDYGYSPCVDNEPPVFQNCPQQPILVQTDMNGGLLPVNFTEPTAVDNSGAIARLEVTPQHFRTPVQVFHDTVVRYVAFDFDGNVAICEVNITVPDTTPPRLSCPQSYVIELVDKQESYAVNFNDTRRRINASDASGEVSIKFTPERAVIPIRGFENVTVTASDKFGNRAQCYFQVAVQATPCVEWELAAPAHGALSCLPGEQGVQCVATCAAGYRFTDGDPVKTFVCENKRRWSPTAVVPDCVSENTQQAAYHVVAGVQYRALGAVSAACLPQYRDLLAQYDAVLTERLSQRCSAVNVDIAVTFVRADPSLLDENIVRMDFVLAVAPAIRQTQLYDLCGSTLNLIFDLSVPYASALIEPLLNVSSIGNQCPPLRALRSAITRGFTCGAGEVLNMDTDDVPRCLHCPAGTFAGEKQKSCTMCPRGFYQNQARQGSCLRCPAGTFTREEGSKDAGECVPVCGYGTYSPTGLVPCLECPRHSYTAEPPAAGHKDCQACGVDTFTYQPAAPARDRCRAKCAPGSYSPTGLAPCSACPRHFYQGAPGQTSCLECPTNTRTVSAGAAVAADCLPVECSNSACQHGGLCVPKGHGVQCYCPAGFSGRRCEVDIDECASQPCYNGGSCTDLPQGYRCQCAPGYGGVNCQEEKSDCRNDTCPERAMCKDEPGYNNYTCLCRSGYTGADCDITIDPCTADGNPCTNGASCIALQQGRFKCECLPGWEGQTCEVNTDDCAEKPCLLGAPCTDLVADFSCACPPGFTGKRCHEKVDLCAAAPCKRGICVDRLFVHRCVCEPGWTGPSCDTNINECLASPCRNGGRCVDGIDGFACACEPGYTGERCQHAVDDCASSPCRNGATCTDLLDGFSCGCRPGYVGLQCETAVDECLGEPCSALGTLRCLDLDNEYRCECRAGYTGELCETDVDDCASAPCHNGGSCRDGVGGFSCACRPGWTGARCESDVGTCDELPCQNDATCIDLFQDYFCVCPSGTDGKACETAPERCVGSPCMHGGSCRDYGSGLNCSCSRDYVGVGCQYEYDACAAGACKNGATCVDRGEDYSCACAPGFTGKDCERDIVDCRDNSCPPAATCIDLPGRFYCQCPFNTTGDDCRKTISVDYDLYLSDPLRSSAAQVVPFATGKTSALTLALWVQFTQQDEGGIFFTAYSVKSPHSSRERRVVLQAHSNGVQVSLFPDLQDAYLGFGEYATINDGQWHHVALVWDGAAGGSLTLVTEGLIASKLSGYGAGRSLPEYAWVTLGKPLSDNPKAYTELGFQGHLTKVQLWNRALDVTNDIQKQVRDCRTEPVLYSGLVLTWAGYEELTGGVARVVPSHCGQRSCPRGYSGTKCQDLQVDKEPPHVEHCPGDLWVIATNGSSLVNWDEPKFSDNVGVVSVEERSGLRPGRTLAWGAYRVAYVARDQAGNSALCTFRLTVLPEFCPPLADPVGGYQTCRDWGAGGQFKVCEVACREGLRFSTPVPPFYTCGAEGFWRPTADPAQSLLYPACSPATAAQRVFKVSMLFPSSVLCNEAGQAVLRQRVRAAINSLNRDWNFCSYSVDGTRECKELDINVKCDHRSSARPARQISAAAEPPAADAAAAADAYALDAIIPVEERRGGREGRQAGDTYNVHVSFPAVNDPVINNGNNERSSVQRLLEKLILEQEQFDVRDILPNTLPDPGSLHLVSDYACPVGQVVVAPDCVPCAVGTYYEASSETCVACPLGTYQSEAGQLQCTPCPSIAGQPGVTRAPGARSADNCKERCAAGKFYDAEAELCRACGHGSYQPRDGAFSCVACPRGQTTRATEAVSAAECRDDCPSGITKFYDAEAELCRACGHGSYQPRDSAFSCVACPRGQTTRATEAVSAAECRDDCPSGITKFYDAKVELCRACGHGSYQPRDGAFSCVASPRGQTTRATEAVSAAEWRDDCPSGEQLGSGGGCEACARGTWRAAGLHASCVPCPPGTTTPAAGAASADRCSLPVCKPGSYLNATLNSCVVCRKGSYQPEMQQAACVPCPINTSTRGPGATSESECTNPCEMSGPEMHCDTNAYCLLVSDTSEFKCQCKPGFNGTGKHCTDVCLNYCDNGGECVKDARGDASCRCAGSFTGRQCRDKSEFAYIASGVAGGVIFIIFLVLLVWMICARSSRKKEPQKTLTPAVDGNGSQVNFYYGAHTPYAESIAPSHHSTYAHYYDDEEDGWEMPNFYNETYMKESLHGGGGGGGGKMNSLARSNASLYGTKDDLYDRLKRHAYPGGKKDKSDSDSEGQ